MIIGLTGGIACGKSTVAAMLAERGAFVVDADRIAREVVMPGEPALAEIAVVFGQAVIRDDGTLDRRKLGEIVFADPEKRKRLEAITHPAIRERMWSRIRRVKADEPGRIVVADVPLLYETGQQGLYDGVVVVYAPREVQIRRLMARNPELTEAQALERINAQMDIERKKELADWIIDNGGSLESTGRQVEALWRELAGNRKP
ncbi:MAG: dephospho-CoA kinase [Thermobacillus sp. ZCTH02-B1]|uniref:dephospho-CoA kinase n=1 Tax=Thermobacillus sp. ZCTH02-B1 TaxID=1858795 RepID=UPI000B54D68C|nr:dephospho-CoA kinase [Thermobacillus sp. ZCTH02-B1]OUM93865.1 MAG: dephospho-CoA kinase [Thermobacillus sp. ZCTH02-B1]